MVRTGCTRIGWTGLVIALCLVAGPGVGWGQVPTESDVYVDRGILAYDNRQYPEALQAFHEAVRLDDTNVNALYYLGLTYLAMEQTEPAQQALERARHFAPNDVDILFQLGVSHFSARQYEKAEPLFRQIYARDSKHQNLGYYLGFIEYRKQDYREALKFFRTNVASDASFAQLARFYAGLALSAMGMAGQARAEIDEAIRSQPVSPLVGPAEKFREVLGKAEKGERNWSVETKIGAFYDDNVTVIPDAGLDATVTAARDQKHRSYGTSGYVRFDYRPLKTPDWEGSMGVSLLGTLNSDVVHYNILNPAISGSLVYRTDLGGFPAVAGVAAQIDTMLLDDRQFSNRYTVAPALSLVWNPRLLTQFLTRVQAKDYMHEKTLIMKADARDGMNYMGGLMHYFRFDKDRHYLRLGYQYDLESTDGSNWDYIGHRLSAGFQYTFPWQNIKLRYDYDFHLRDYRHQHSYLPITEPGTKSRFDQEMSSVVALYKELPNNVTLSLEWLWNKDESNLELFSYIRNVVTLALAWRY